eukprot:3800263-Alexandrium_andersonii.AAC.1
MRARARARVCARHGRARAHSHARAREEVDSSSVLDMEKLKLSWVEGLFQMSRFVPRTASVLL